MAGPGRGAAPAGSGLLGWDLGAPQVSGTVRSVWDRPGAGRTVRGAGVWGREGRGRAGQQPARCKAVPLAERRAPLACLTSRTRPGCGAPRAQASCPNCGEVNTTYFGDILTVQGAAARLGASVFCGPFPHFPPLHRSLLFAACSPAHFPHVHSLGDCLRSRPGARASSLWGWAVWGRRAWDGASHNAQHAA